MNAAGDFARFLSKVYALKDEPRRGWIESAGIQLPESVAEHTWGVVLLAFLLGESLGLDRARLMELALIHDLSEAIVGDITPKGALGTESKKALESSAFYQLTSQLPEKLRGKMNYLWYELQSSVSAEAKIAWELDKLEMAVQAWHYRRQGYNKRRLGKFVDSARSAVSEAILVRLIQALSL